MRELQKRDWRAALNNLRRRPLKQKHSRVGVFLKRQIYLRFFAVFFVVFFLAAFLTVFLATFFIIFLAAFFTVFLAAFFFAAIVVCI
jgi:hypothetical protein